MLPMHVADLTAAFIPSRSFLHHDDPRHPFFRCFETLAFALSFPLCAFILFPLLSPLLNSSIEIRGYLTSSVENILLFFFTLRYPIMKS